MAASLLPFPLFDATAEPQLLGARWNKWLQRFDNFLVAMNIAQPARKRALLLHYVGETVYDIFDTLPDTGGANDYEAATARLTEYFAPQKNVEFEIYVFRQAKQELDETTDQFQTRLRKLASTCDFPDIDKEVKSQVIRGCRSNKLRRHALKTRNISLSDLLTEARSMESTEQQAKLMETGKDSHDFDNSHGGVNQIRLSRGKENRPSPRPSYSNQPPKESLHATNRSNFMNMRMREDRQDRLNTQSKVIPQGRKPPLTTCQHCGGPWPHIKGQESCPARGKECNNCGKLNHFSRCCRSQRQHTLMSRENFRTETQRSAYVPRQINLIESQQAGAEDRPEADRQRTEDEYVYGVHDHSSVNLPSATLIVEGRPITFIVDTGASVNLLTQSAYNAIANKPTLQKTAVKIFPYGSLRPLQLMGHVDLMIENDTSFAVEPFLVVACCSGQSVIGYHTAETLGLVHFDTAIKFLKPRQPQDHAPVSTREPMYHLHLGKLKDSVIQLHIDETIPSVAQKHRRIPFHLRGKIEAEIQNLLTQDIIEKATGPTPWVSPVVVVPKHGNPNEIRLCVDMRAANKAIIRERHPIPTIDDITHMVKDATIFSKLDLEKGYHQIEISEDTRYITTFSTHVGLFRYKRLNFGISSASEIFQNIISETLTGINGVLNASDDLLVFGKDQAEHDVALQKTLQRLKEKGLTLNEQKCVFSKHEVKFLGLLFSSEGLKVDPEKVQDVMMAPTPTSPTEIRSFLGLVNFNARFIPDLSAIAQPLRDLTHMGAKWIWTPCCQEAFEEIKCRISKATNLSFFQPDQCSILYVDASPCGLGALFTQQKHEGTQKIPILYASKTLTNTERRYSQIEREGLAIYWAIKHFHIYLYGAPFQVITDHKPLVKLFNNPFATLSARLERWRFNLQEYSFEVKYEPGKDNPADFLSRHPNKKESISSAAAEEYVHMIISNSPPNAIQLQEVIEATREDATLQSVINRLMQKTNWDNPPETEVDTGSLKSFQMLRHELSLATTGNGSLVIRGTRIVMPLSLQTKSIELAHQGHQGITRTKSLLREKIWFPGLDKAVEAHISQCSPCSQTTPQPTRLPLKMTQLPEAPWIEVSIDLGGPFPDGHYILVVIDNYSRFVEMETITSTSSTAVIPKLDKIFASFGIPKKVTTDNGPPFNGQEFRKFTERLGIQHRKVMPLWPQANGEVERAMRTIKKGIQTAYIEKGNWRQNIFTFLRNYRATPHPSTGKSPAELLFNRKMRITLPELTETAPHRKDIEPQDTYAKARAKAYSDRRSTHTDTPLKLKDHVLVKNERKNKLTPLFGSEQYEVISTKGPMITAQKDNHTLTRHASFFKKVPQGEHPSMPEQTPVTKSTSPELQEKRTHQRKRQPPKRLITEL